MADSYPRRKARTRGFTLGAPRSFSTSRDGSRVVFLRSAAGDDPRTALWVLEDGEERLVAEAPEAARLTPEERARRERTREVADGITSYAIDDDASVAAFAVGGALYVVDIASGDRTEYDTQDAAFDPRPDPTGERVAFVLDRGLYIAEHGGLRELVGEPGVSWGLAEFIAAEEMGRHYGYRWSRDGDALLVARVDDCGMEQWWIPEGIDPNRRPRPMTYPAAGRANEDVSLHIVTLEGRTRKVELPEPYLTRFDWDAHGPLAVAQSRDQKGLLTIDAETGEILCEQTDEAWVELVQGVPARLDDGRLVTVDHELLKVDGETIAPELHVRAVHNVGTDIVFTASTDPTETHIYRWDGALSQLTTEPGVHAYADAVVGRRSLDTHGCRWTYRDHVFASHAHAPDALPEPRLLTVGERELRVAVLLPVDHDGGKVPVLLSPYGGPHHQSVMQSSALFYDHQWFADQGFAVLVADNRGTPGRGREFTTAVDGDLGSAPLEDQVDALRATAELLPELDLDKVAIRGWSFGGWLAALAVLRRPDVFHAAIAGAPVTDWRLYDTHYTERYLEPPFPSLIPEAPNLQRPLMLIHGLADDNVVAAHSLALSQALTASGRPHTFLPLPGITHMTPREDIAENLLLLQVDFLRRALGVRPDPERS